MPRQGYVFHSSSFPRLHSKARIFVLERPLQQRVPDKKKCTPAVGEHADNRHPAHHRLELYLQKSRTASCVLHSLTLHLLSVDPCVLTILPKCSSWCLSLSATHLYLPNTSPRRMDMRSLTLCRRDSSDRPDKSLTGLSRSQQRNSILRSRLHGNSERGPQTDHTGGQGLRVAARRGQYHCPSPQRDISASGGNQTNRDKG